jgi:hypothetical protein
MEYEPTATHVVADPQETLSSALTVDSLGKGVERLVQAEPFHVTATMLPPPDPTATQASRERHATELK